VFSLIKRIAIVAALGAALSGCVVVHTTKQELLYSPEYIAWAAVNGSYPVEINGNPLGSSALADEKLLSAMTMPHWIIPRNFHQIPTADRGTGHRLVLVFNPVSPFTSGDSLCEQANPETTRPGTVMKIFGALCSADDNVTRATAEAEVQPGLHDPRFIELLNYLLTATLPERNMDYDSTDCQAPPCG